MLQLISYIFSFVGGTYAFFSILINWYQSRVRLMVNATEYYSARDNWTFARFQVVNRSRLPINITSITMLKAKDINSYELKVLNHESYITTLQRPNPVNEAKDFNYPLMSTQFPIHLDSRASREVTLSIPPDANSLFEENKYLCCYTDRGKKSFLVSEENKSKVQIDKFL